MKKIIIALDGQNFPAGAFEFVKDINSKNPVLLAGVFLSPVDYSKVIAFSGMEGMTVMPEWLMRDGDDKIVSRNIKLFDEACVRDGIEYRIHKDTDLMAISSLLEETRFADLLVLSSDLFYSNIAKEQPNYYLEEVLKKSECPVMLIPENYKEPGQVVLSYDGSDSSMFAIKQFAYIFPELTSKESILLHVNVHDEDMPEYNLVSELVGRHFPNLKMHPLAMDNKKFFTQWIENQPNSFVVMGAFSRSLISQLFKKSFAAEVIHDVKMPIFISHK